MELSEFLVSSAKVHKPITFSKVYIGQDKLGKLGPAKCRVHFYSGANLDTTPNQQITESSGSALPPPSACQNAPVICKCQEQRARKMHWSHKNKTSKKIWKRLKIGSEKGEEGWLLTSAVYSLTDWPEEYLEKAKNAIKINWLFKMSDWKWRCRQGRFKKKFHKNDIKIIMWKLLYDIKGSINFKFSKAHMESNFAQQQQAQQQTVERRWHNKNGWKGNQNVGHLKKKAPMQNVKWVAAKNGCGCHLQKGRSPPSLSTKSVW